MIATDLLVLAAEGGVSPDHVAAKLAVPVSLLIFGGAMFALLWSNYGAKKGALIFFVAQFGFNALFGVFWWFGAPGVPVALGPQNLPGQAGDNYTAKWFPFEAESPRAGEFEAWREFDAGQPGPFQTVDEFTGTTDEEDPLFTTVRGDLDAASALMLEQFFPMEGEALQIGASLRTELQELTPEAPDGARFDGWVTEIAGNSEDSEFGAEDSQLFVTEDQGQRVSAAVLETYAVYVADGGDNNGSEVGRQSIMLTEWFAFKDPGALWFPSALWTIVFGVLTAVSLVALDRIEQREKREQVVAEEPMDVQVPIAQ